MEDDENNEEVEKTNTNKEMDTEAAKQLEKLNEYVQQMAYRPTQPPKGSDRTESLSKAPKKYFVGTYSEHKDNLKPKERSDRIAAIVQKHTPMTIENLEKFIRNHRKKQAQQENDKKQQQIKYHETLTKLQKQCENQLMNAIVHKFAKIVSKKASVILPASSETESCQRLQNALVCNMIMALKVPNDRQTRDLTVYKKLAVVFADLIFQALFLANNSDYKNFADDQEEQLPKNNEKDLVIKMRALKAAKKNIYQNRLKSSRGCAVLSHRLNK
ncbi:uncharacterized protein LOC129907589 [Episyrphus balteatus]|uniref:uncharacterized protein LOC129907589 n=1 Tax=Episyrphus balteatus TaxID=286459 RepID=UPI002485C9EF|nr:uncharacterized protein LOC129907589 [Episyrphus balteatus]